LFTVDQVLELISVQQLFGIVAFTAFIAAICTAFIERAIYKFLYKRLLESPRIWDDILLESIHIPLQFLIWVAALSILLDQLTRFSTIFNYHSIQQFIEIALIVLLGWFFLRFIKHLEHRLIFPETRKYQRLDSMTIHAICHVARIVIIVFLCLSLLQILGFSSTGIVAFGGFGGAALAFSAKDMLANLFGGFMIFWDRPFTVGDWISSHDHSIEGYVEYIGWRLTRIRTAQRRLRYIPNGLFSAMVIENITRMSHRRIETNIGVRYDDAEHLPAIIEEMDNYIKEHPMVDQQLTNIIRFSNFGASSLDIYFMVYTRLTGRKEFYTFQQEVFLKIIEIISNNNSECAFPTQTVHHVRPEKVGFSMDKAE
jgi:MscS family membrane protein